MPGPHHKILLRLPGYLSFLFLMLYLGIVLLAWPSRSGAIAVFDGDAPSEEVHEQESGTPSNDSDATAIIAADPLSVPTVESDETPADAVTAPKPPVIRRWWWSAFLGTAFLAVVAIGGFYYLSRTQE